MTQEVAYRFVEALAALEQHGQADPILETFSESCEVGSSSSSDVLQGREGAREYWNKYRAAFRDIRSTIRNLITGDDSIALEWTTQATDRSGKEFQYCGVSILEIRDSAIVRFTAYFDTKHLTGKIQPQQAQVSAQANLTAAAS